MNKQEIIYENIKKALGYKYKIKFISLQIEASTGIEVFVYNNQELLMVRENGNIVWCRNIKGIEEISATSKVPYLENKQLKVKLKNGDERYFNKNGDELYLREEMLLDERYIGYINSNIDGAICYQKWHTIPCFYNQELKTGYYSVNIIVENELGEELIIYDHLGQVRYRGGGNIINFDTVIYQKALLRLCSYQKIKIKEIEVEKIVPQKVMHFIGDSTLAINYELPRFGWAQVFQTVNPIITNNLAASGRSLKSFCFEGRFNLLLNQIKEGDTVVIGFGHNDEKDTYFGSNIDEYIEYIKYYKQEIEARGTRVIITTPIARRKFVDSELVNTHKGYDQAIIEYFNTENIVDLNNKFMKKINDLGEEKSKKLFLHYPELALEDDTHLSLCGASVIARIFDSKVQSNL